VAFADVQLQLQLTLGEKLNIYCFQKFFLQDIIKFRFLFKAVIFDLSY